MGSAACWETLAGDLQTFRNHSATSRWLLGNLGWDICYVVKLQVLSVESSKGSDLWGTQTVSRN